MNNLQSNLLKQHWTAFSTLSSATSQHVGQHCLTYGAPFYSMLGTISWH